MNKLRRYMFFALMAATWHLYATSYAAAGTIQLTKGLTADELRCLHDLMVRHFVHYPGRDEIKKLIAEASAARAHLRDAGERAFLFVIHDIGYCGSAGCRC